MPNQTNTNVSVTGQPPQGFFLDINIASTLEGKTLNSGWEILEKLSEDKGKQAKYSTGGFFSVCYRAQRKLGGTVEEGFLKVFDIASAMMMNGNNFMRSLNQITSSHQFECAMLDICKTANFDRIVRIIDRGEEQLATQQGFPMPIAYIVFEKADGDIRKAIRKATSIEHVWIFTVLHNVAVGINQLHGKKITHQDLKPSNVLTFDIDNKGAKIGDLGRAVAHGHTLVGHESDAVAGDRGYAPPEQAYEHRAAEWVDRRESCDLYHLGCLMCFLFAATQPNQFYKLHLDKSILPALWQGQSRGNYEEALPHLSSVFAQFLESIANSFPDWCREECLELVRRMCNPDYRLRGDPKTRAMHGKPLGVDRFITTFNRLSLEAKINTKSIN